MPPPPNKPHRKNGNKTFFLRVCGVYTERQQRRRNIPAAGYVRLCGDISYIAQYVIWLACMRARIVLSYKNILQYFPQISNIMCVFLFRRTYKKIYIKQTHFVKAFCLLYLVGSGGMLLLMMRWHFVYILCVQADVYFRIYT